MTIIANSLLNINNKPKDNNLRKDNNEDNIVKFDDLQKDFQQKSTPNEKIKNEEATINTARIFKQGNKLETQDGINLPTKQNLLQEVNLNQEFLFLEDNILQPFLLTENESLSIEPSVIEFYSPKKADEKDDINLINALNVNYIKPDPIIYNEVLAKENNDTIIPNQTEIYTPNSTLENPENTKEPSFTTESEVSKINNIDNKFVQLSINSTEQISANKDYSLAERNETKTTIQINENNTNFAVKENYGSEQNNNEEMNFTNNNEFFDTDNNSNSETEHIGDNKNKADFSSLLTKNISSAEKSYSRPSKEPIQQSNVHTAEFEFNNIKFQISRKNPTSEKVEISLKPAIGKIDITLEIPKESNQAKITISSDSREALVELQKAADRLTEALNRIGIQTGHSPEFNLRDSNNRQNEKNEFNNESSDRNENNSNEAVAVKMYKTNLIDPYAIIFEQGNLDISI